MALSGLRRVISVLSYRDNAIYTAGNSLSLIGLRMQLIGVGFLLTIFDLSVAMPVLL